MPEITGPQQHVLKDKLKQAKALHQQRKLAAAERICREVLQQQPNHSDALHLLGVIAIQTGYSERAVALLTRALELNPNLSDAHKVLAFALIALNRREQALTSLDKAIAVNPADAEAYTTRGNVLNHMKRHDEALKSYTKAIAVNQNYASAYYNCGIALYDLKRHDEALVNFDKAIALAPDFADAHCNRGNTLYAIKRPEEALSSYENAIALKPDHVDAYYNRGAALNDLQRYDESLVSFDKVIALKPDFAEAHYGRGTVLTRMKCFDEALASYDTAISFKLENVDLHNNRGETLSHLKRFQEALANYNTALALDPGHEFLYGKRLHTKMMLCDWRNLCSETAHIVEKIERSERVSPPFPILSVSNSTKLQWQAAEIWTHAKNPTDNSLRIIQKQPLNDKIHVGYFSADFREHPLAILAAELFECHDRTKFDTTAFSFGTNKGGWITQRLERAFDRFIDVSNQCDRNVALLARSLGIDIAVDLMGHTRDSRTRIFSMRAAPVQVNYLGYPGTMGAEYMDYLIADRTLITSADQTHYTEKIAYLPNTYMPHDSTLSISEKRFNRADFGLPQSAFVFCCFNNAYKLNPDIFDRWMRIIQKVDGSVLWLSENNPAATANLRKEAENKHINPERLVFAKRMVSLADHLARHRLADLFLDTLPFNAHTTASDALWAGLPVLTQVGQTFAGRVAASLLTAIGLPELIVSTPQSYEDLAIELATNPTKLAAINTRLANNRLTTPLFDTKLFAKHIETAYTAMHERYRAGLPPDHIFVPH